MRKKNNKKKRKKLLVGIFVDFMGAGVGEDEITPVEEIKEIEDLFTGYFPKYEFLFISSTGIHELLGKQLDIFIIDYGGILPGAPGLVEGISGAVDKYVKDHPSCIVVLWSAMSVDNYEEYIGTEIKGSIEGPNVLIKGKTFWEDLKGLLDDKM